MPTDACPGRGVLQGEVSGNERGRWSDLRPAPPHQRPIDGVARRERRARGRSLVEGDFNNDGRSHGLWYNASRGPLVVRLVNRAWMSGGVSPGSAASPWLVQGLSADCLRLTATQCVEQTNDQRTAANKRLRAEGSNS